MAQMIRGKLTDAVFFILAGKAGSCTQARAHSRGKSQKCGIANNIICS